MSDIYKYIIGNSTIFKNDETPQDMIHKRWNHFISLVDMKTLGTLGIGLYDKNHDTIIWKPLGHKQMGGPIFPTSMKFSAVKDRIFTGRGRIIGSK